MSKTKKEDTDGLVTSADVPSRKAPEVPVTNDAPVRETGGRLDHDRN